MKFEFRSSHSAPIQTKHLAATRIEEYSYRLEWSTIYFRTGLTDV